MRDFDTLAALLTGYVFYYPVIMSIFWMVGGIYFYWRRERGQATEPPKLARRPLVSVLVPAHNEERDIEDAVRSIFHNSYANLEVIVINDASTDRTQEVLNGMLAEFPALKVLQLEKNMGKAHGLNLALAMSHGEIIVTLDADSMLSTHAIEWAVWHFVNFPRVGAVTGKPRVRNRSTLLAKIQTAEYSSVIGLIKRCQRLLGKVMTVSGVVTAWRRTAIIHAGLWNTSAITDDIEMSWRIQEKFWDIRYEPNCLCYMLVPETLSGLWKQRRRWAQGGVEVMRLHKNVWKNWRERRIWPIYLDYILGACWAYAFLFCIILWTVRFVLSFVLPEYAEALAFVDNPFWGWNGAVVAAICLLQLFVSIGIDHRYDNNLWKVYFWVAWYPVVYWSFNALTTIAALPRGLLRDMSEAAVWVSPDRGMR